MPLACRYFQLAIATLTDRLPQFWSAQIKGSDLVAPVVACVQEKSATSPPDHGNRGSLLSDTPQHWTVDQVRRFYKAIKVHGKNFYAIHRDFFSSTTSMDPIGGDGGSDPAPRAGPRGRKRRGHHHALESKRTLTSAASVPASLFSLARDTPTSTTTNLPESEVEEVSKVENMKVEEADELAMRGRKGYEFKSEPPDDVKSEDKDREDKSSASSTRSIFQPTREKTVKQLITFYYYWKRKSASTITSATSVAAAHAAAAAAAAANAAASNSNSHHNRNTFKGSSVEANFNRCYAGGKKRKQIGTRAGIMDRTAYLRHRTLTGACCCDGIIYDHGDIAPSPPNPLTDVASWFLFLAISQTPWLALDHASTLAPCVSRPRVRWCTPFELEVAFLCDHELATTYTVIHLPFTFVATRVLPDIGLDRCPHQQVVELASLSEISSVIKEIHLRPHGDARTAEEAAVVVEWASVSPFFLMPDFKFASRHCSVGPMSAPVIVNSANSIAVDVHCTLAGSVANNLPESENDDIGNDTPQRPASETASPADAAASNTEATDDASKESDAKVSPAAQVCKHCNLKEIANTSPSSGENHLSPNLSIWRFTYVGVLDAQDISLDNRKSTSSDVFSCAICETSSSDRRSTPSHRNAVGALITLSLLLPSHCYFLSLIPLINGLLLCLLLQSPVVYFRIYQHFEMSPFCVLFGGALLQLSVRTFVEDQRNPVQCCCYAVSDSFIEPDTAKEGEAVVEEEDADLPLLCVRFMLAWARTDVVQRRAVICPVIRQLCSACRLHLRKYAELPKVPEVKTEGVGENGAPGTAKTNWPADGGCEQIPGKGSADDAVGRFNFTHNVALAAPLAGLFLTSSKMATSCVDPRSAKSAVSVNRPPEGCHGHFRNQDSSPEALVAAFVRLMAATYFVANNFCAGVVRHTNMPPTPVPFGVLLTQEPEEEPF
ncbi:unnamed protein product [Mesocestoides corti]|uniref:Uncharacterized protein n=1 Tax=Mesocestoides corti TaxID=53468 RepID=A0A0R3UI13_MESCO|nr:unnamed protein product [Mesocestoides corti]